MSKARNSVARRVARAALGASLLLLVTGAKARAGASTPGPWATDACATGEHWSFGGNRISADSRAELVSFLRGRSTPERGFSEALALSRMGGSATPTFLGQYWAARALYDEKQIHAAFQGFTHLFAQPPSTGTLGIQLAAAQCLERITARDPQITLPIDTAATIHRYLYLAQGPSARPEWSQTLWRLAGRHFREQLSLKRPSSELEQTLELLRGAGLHERLARGLWAAQRTDFPAVVQELSAFLSGMDTGRPGAAALAPFQDQAHLLLARALFAEHRYDEAARQLRQVSKSSNELIEALSELAWAALEQGRYGEAVGAGISLGRGGLKHTFAPEGMMVTAMAFNELCQYPESLRAIQGFKDSYRTAYSWLARWEERKNVNYEQLYDEAVGYLRHEQQVPDPIASEWIRSRSFISMQDELNQLADETEAARKVSRDGLAEQRRMGRELQARLEQLQAGIRAERGHSRKYETGLATLSPGLRADALQLRADVLHYRRFRRAGVVWASLRSNLERTAPRTRIALRDAIGREITARNRHMLAQLRDIADNNELVEVEIYQGAGEDIIWQNAHPAETEWARKSGPMSYEAASRVWDWGSAPMKAEEWNEIWEDELGSFKVKLADNCSNRERYLKVGPLASD